MFITLILLVFVAKGIGVAFVHAPFSGHDEVMHYAYLEFVAQDHRLPVIPELSTWQAHYASGQPTLFDMAPDTLWDYCRFTTPDWNIRGGCGTRDSPVRAVFWPPTEEHLPHGWIYTANHPPLYYLILTPVYWLVDDLSLESQLYVFRLATIPFGLLTVLFAYLTVRTLFPRDRFLAMTVPVVVAFQPQISYEASMLNNDAAAIAFTSGVLYLLVRGLGTGFPFGVTACIGFCHGLAVLSKNTSLAIGLAIAVTMMLGLGIRNWKDWLSRGAVAAGVAALMIWPWFAYMVRTYGDLTALGRVGDLQYWNYADGFRPTIWSQLTDQEFAWLRWRETWGEFGWRLIPLSNELLWALLGGMAAGLVGLGVWCVRVFRALRRCGPDNDNEPGSSTEPSVFIVERWQVVGVVTMVVTCVTSYALMLQFGVSFALTQARYFFPAVIPAAILVMLGYRTLLPERLLRGGQVAVFLAMVLLNVVIYSAYVLPYWTTAARLVRDIDPLYR